MVGVAEELLGTARLCEQSLAAWVDELPPFATSLLLAAAALQTAAEALEARPLQRESALLIGATMARDAAAATRRHTDDESLRPCAEACERAARLCEAELRARRGRSRPSS